MLSFQEALEEDKHLGVLPPGDVDDFADGWDVDVFPDADLRPEIRLFANAPPNVTLQCRDGRSILAHREVLAECSYFDKMFNGSFCERQADFLGIDADSSIFLEVVRWIYCRDASVDKEIVLEVMGLADHYGLDELEEHCARALAAHNLAGAGKQASKTVDAGKQDADAQHTDSDEEDAQQAAQEAEELESWTVVTSPVPDVASSSHEGAADVVPVLPQQQPFESTDEPDRLQGKLKDT
mmetsp:Transcript_19693/g.35641  ORF Transcript_19693/g.35641 Transcript_19693/m.35641 type:complete len:239 (+) Transcript_19693:52-768(+)